MEEFTEPEKLAEKFMKLLDVINGFQLQMEKAQGAINDNGKAIPLLDSDSAKGRTSVLPQAVTSGALLTFGVMFSRGDLLEKQSLKYYHEYFKPLRQSMHQDDVEACEVSCVVEQAWDQCQPEDWDNCRNAMRSEIKQLKEQLDEKVQVIYNSFPNAGTYLNEASYFEKDWQTTFWGKNYEKLLKIKQKVDPQDLFICHHCVGSEFWDASGNCKL